MAGPDGLSPTDLARAGIREAGAVAAAVAPVRSWLGAADAAHIVAGLRRTADPMAAVHALATLLDAVAPAASGVDVETLLVVLGGSASLRQTLVAVEGEWPHLVATITETAARGVDEHRERLERALAQAQERAAVQSVLRRYCRREELRIGGRDLAGLATVDETVREISALAQATVGAALAATRRRLERTWPGAAAAPFVVFGMGKLGGSELNYSSDIDLVYVYGEDATLADGRTLHEYFGRVGEELRRALAEVTPDGFCFRVDLRLRPAGNDGPIAAPVGGVLSYYESWGQTWERAVWLKARPVAGDEALGARVLHELEPFVYRRYLDYATIEALQAMKRRVDVSLRDEEQRRRNVKLGRGGIREVEFWVQAQQLVHGGKDQRLRLRGTLEALDRLAETGYVPAGLRDRLAAAYRFLRDVEHKLQIVDRRQTQTIPGADDECERLARRLGIVGPDAVARFWAVHARHTNAVQAAFDELFRPPEQAAEPSARAEIVALLDPLASEATLDRLLAQLGLREPTAARHNFRLLAGDMASTPASGRRRQVLERLGPPLLEEIVASADPDQALAHMASFIANVGARTSYLHLLGENAGVRRLLVRLFASSEFLSRFFLRHPELLEALVRVDLVRVVRAPDDLTRELSERLAATTDLEGELDEIRRFRNEEFLRIGIHDLEGELDPPAVERQLSDVATVCLDAAVTMARRDVCRRTGTPDTPETDGLAVVAMGKLGGRELNYHADLDLVFVWTSPADGRWTGTTDAQDFYTRVAQRTISVLQTQTTEGYAYKIDTRLRPSGNQGTLVTSVAAFEDYHRRSAAVWERQALIKARVVRGPIELRRRIEAAVDEFVYGRSLSDEELVEIRRIRSRMERERGSEQSIKTGEGGVVDVEFAVQVLQLLHGHADPGLRTPATREALVALERSRHVGSALVQALRDGYEFLRRLEMRLRIERDQPVDALSADPLALQRLARRLGYAGPAEEAAAALAHELAGHRAAIRAAYGAVVGAADASA